jgi:predicted  nucleic acid-binding Zn-ribbon protein
MFTQREFDEMQDAAVTSHYEVLALRQQVAKLEQELKALRAFRDAVSMASFIAGIEAVQPDMINEVQP